MCEVLFTEDIILGYSQEIMNKETNNKIGIGTDLLYTCNDLNLKNID